MKEIEVKSAVPGALEIYYVGIGDQVKKGDKIAKIKILSEPSQIESAKTNMKTAAIVFEKDKLNYEREKRLFEKGVISAGEFEEASKTFNVSSEQYEYMKKQLHLLVEGYIPSSNVSNVVTATADGTVIDLPREEGSPVIEMRLNILSRSLSVLAFFAVNPPLRDHLQNVISRVGLAR